MGKKKEGIFLSHNENGTKNVVESLELDSEFFVQEEQREERFLT